MSDEKHVADVVSSFTTEVKNITQNSESTNKIIVHKQQLGIFYSSNKNTYKSSRRCIQSKSKLCDVIKSKMARVIFVAWYSEYDVSRGVFVAVYKTLRCVLCE